MTTAPTFAVLCDQLDAAVVNDYSFDGWTAEEIASDLIAYSEDFFDVPKDDIIPLVERWQKGERP